MAPPVPISGITSRINSIRERIDPQASMHPLMTAGAPVTPPPVENFEPFGAVYQEALETARARPSASSPMTWALGGDRLMQSGGIGRYSGAGGGEPVNQFAVPTGASVGKVGGYGRLGPPNELAVYGNGQIPAAALEPIGQGGHRLWGPAAQAWRGAVEAAAADGISLRITDSYRSFDEQVDLVNRKGLYSEGGLGAKPGTSNHGWGLAVDANVNDPRTLEWMRTNAWRFGFVEAVPREPWHWEFRPHQA